MAAGTDDTPPVSDVAPEPKRFYKSAFTEVEEGDLAEAEKMDGLDQEIAVLRVRLKAALREERPDFAVVFRGFDLLIKAVSAQYRLSPRASKDLGARVIAAMKGFEDQLLPPDP